MKKVPEIGDLIKVNPEFKKEWWRKISKTAAFPDNGKTLEVKTVEISGDDIYVSWDDEHGLVVDKNCRCVQPPLHYSDNEVFIIVEDRAEKRNDNNAIQEGTYCSCGGTGKENWACGARFMVCTICKKEQV